jgi:diguanylate cyclase (GGDEF)-like protein
MDPFTAIAILAAHLVCSGALFVVIWRRQGTTDETIDWAIGAFCFGAGFAGRVAVGLSGAGPVAAASDSLMLVATLFFARGMTKLAGNPWPLHRMLAAAALLAATHTVATLYGGQYVRFVLLNALLGLLYAVLAFMAWRPIVLRACHERQRLPLGFSAAMVGALSIASFARTAHIYVNGTSVLYSGPAASAYFAFSSLVAVLLVFAMLWVVFERLNGELAELASLDALTRVLNRNGLQLALVRHFAARPPAPLTLLIVDLDHFKSVNDRHGHAGGDKLLRAVADCLAQACRGSDFVARYGGEEFVIGCRTGQPEVAEQLAARICERAGALRVRLPDGATVGCTVSVGISPVVPSLADWERAYEQADKALYEAKAKGRNRWVRFEA